MSTLVNRRHDLRVDFGSQRTRRHSVNTASAHHQLASRGRPICSSHRAENRQLTSADTEVPSAPHEARPALRLDTRHREHIIASAPGAGNRLRAVASSMTIALLLASNLLATLMCLVADAGDLL
jgi:hypothetical protein